MTEAQRANLHMLETWPRERICRHEWKYRDDVQEKPRSKERGRSRSGRYNRAWIAEHAAHYTVDEMCIQLGLAPSTVWWHLQCLKMSAKRGAVGRPRKLR
jgi:hypothetical protein